VKKNRLSLNNHKVRPYKTSHIPLCTQNKTQPQICLLFLILKMWKDWSGVKPINWYSTFYCWNLKLKIMLIWQCFLKHIKNSIPYFHFFLSVCRYGIHNPNPCHNYQHICLTPVIYFQKTIDFSWMFNTRFQRRFDMCRNYNRCWIRCLCSQCRDCWGSPVV